MGYPKIWHGSAKTSSAAAVSISLAGCDQIEVAVQGDEAYYLILPSSSTSTIATISAAAEKQTNYVWDFTVDTNAVFDEGMPVEVLDTSNSDANILRGVIKGSSANSLAATSQESAGTKHITVVSSYDQEAAIASTDKIRWMTPIADAGAGTMNGLPIGVLIREDDSHIVDVPLWARTNGVLKFVRAASTDVTVTVHHLITRGTC